MTLRAPPPTAARPGTVYIVGAGPGDPGLLTLRGRRVLAEADVVLYDALVSPRVLGFARPEAEKRYVGKRGGAGGGTPQDEINRAIVAEARSGRIVVRLKGGDPFLFGRGPEEALALGESGIPFEIVPGVSSPIAAAAYAGITLTHRELSSSVAFITGHEAEEKPRTAHDWKKLATGPNTIVFLMGSLNLAENLRALAENGRAADTPAAVVQWGTRPEQRTVVGTVANLAARVAESGIGPPMLVVVGEVVRLRDRLRWFDAFPLFGKRVLVTRAEEETESFADALLERGAEPVALPAIRFEPPADATALRAAARAVADYALVAFTSQTAVERFFDALVAEGLDARAFGRAKVAAVGPATAAALGQHGVRADVVPGEHRGEAAARAIRAAMDLSGKRVLLPRAEVAREALPETLRAAGATVDVVAAYRTSKISRDDPLAGEIRAQIASGRIDAITLTSGSTAEAVAGALGRDVPPGIVVASIGPVTTEAAEGLGLRVDVTAQAYTTAGLLRALEDRFAKGAR